MNSAKERFTKNILKELLFPGNGNTSNILNNQVQSPLSDRNLINIIIENQFPFKWNHFEITPYLNLNPYKNGAKCFPSFLQISFCFWKKWKYQKSVTNI